MELKVRTKSLIEEVVYALSIVEQKSTFPILSHFLLNSSSGVCELAASDLEVTYRGKIEAEVIKGEAITVPAKSFAQIIRGFNNSNELLLKLNAERRLSVKPLDKKAEYFLNTLPAEDFPRLIDPPEKGFFLPLSIYKEMVKEVLVSIGLEDDRFSVSGVLFVVEPNSLIMVSTDSHRLSYSSRKIEISNENQFRILIPRKVLQETLKFNKSDLIHIFTKDSHIFFKSGDILLYSRLKDAKFPAYEKVIPTDVPITAVIKRENFLESLKRISNVADIKTKAVHLHFNSEGTIQIETRNEEGDKGEEFITCDSYNGEDIKLLLNCNYMLDFLTSIHDELKIKDRESQCLFEPLREEDKGICKNVVMPLRADLE